MNEKSAVNPPVVSPGAPVGVRKVYRPAGLGPVGTAGTAKGGKAVAVERPGQRVLRGGWVFVYWMAALMLVMGFAAVASGILENSRHQGAASAEGVWHLHPAVKGFSAFGVVIGYYPLYLMLSVYSIVWFVVPVVAICQGRASAGIAYLFGSPLLLMASGMIGCVLGLLLR